MNKMQNRSEQLKKLLVRQGTVSLAEIQQEFGISESTARRMCKAAEEDGTAVRICGGVLRLLLPQNTDEEYFFSQRAVEHIEEKKVIGCYASMQVENGDIIFVSGGTTTESFIRFLAERIKTKEITDVTIMTNSICNAEILGDMVNVILTGGIYRPKRRDVAGYTSEATIRGAHFNKCFIGVDGIELSDGLMALDQDTGNMDRLVTSRSETAYILADSGKFCAKPFISYEHFLPKHIILTDHGVPKDALDLAKERGIVIIDCNKELENEKNN